MIVLASFTISLGNLLYFQNKTLLSAQSKRSKNYTRKTNATIKLIFHQFVTQVCDSLLYLLWLIICHCTLFEDISNCSHKHYV